MLAAYEIWRGTIRQKLREEREFLPALVGFLVSLRDKARREENFELADAIRDALAAAGVTVSDARLTPDA